MAVIDRILKNILRIKSIQNGFAEPFSTVVKN